VNAKTQPTIMLVGQDTALGYLLGRFAERSGFQLTISSEDLRYEVIVDANPAAIIFLSPELLKSTQDLVGPLTNLDALIMVCSSMTDETRARELGADHCLLHPLRFDDFQKALKKTAKGT
jgi:hypothetical protein